MRCRRKSRRRRYTSFNVLLLLRLQRALYLGWPYLGRCPRLYTAAPTACAGCGDFSMKAKVVAFFPMAIAENEKTDL